MIDFHSHVLPGIDDGSRDLSMSLQMLAMMKQQGIDTVCATSHFYASQRSPERFLMRRREAFEKLQPRLTRNAPRILLGAEVLYFPGISRMASLHRLCLQGTDLLLLEMPFEVWQASYLREVRELALSGEYTVMLAHVERYYDQQPRSVWDSLLDLGVLMQSNAEFFLPFRAGHLALKLLKQGRIHLLGTDAHNTSSRSPQMDLARAKISRHLGQQALDRIDRLGESLLRSR